MKQYINWRRKVKKE